MLSHRDFRDDLLRFNENKGGSSELRNEAATELRGR
jgi:hypothetical protein